MLNKALKALSGLLLLAMFSNANAYNIGGAYASLIDCSWGKYGYQYGYIGLYEVNGRRHEVFFGDGFCKH